MMDRKCVCIGIKLARTVVEHTDNPAIPGSLQAAQAIYNHLLEQVNKPHNAKLKQELEKDFEDMRFDLMKDKYTDHPGVMAMERVRDKIHKSTPLKNLLICGETFRDKKERDDVLKIIEITWTIMADAGEKGSPYEDVSEAYGPLDDLAEHFGC